ncbi:MAG: AAA family ATPase [Acidimicrobiales bacterium]
MAARRARRRAPRPRCRPRDRARALFLLGDAGSGKTRLARELIERRRAAGWTTATARATEATRPVPLGALAHLVPIGESATPHAVIDGLRRALAAEGAAPALLHVDDAHQLDPSSATALVGLAESGAVRLVLTARLGTSLPDALGALRAADESRTVVVDDLSPEEGAALLARVLGPVDGIASAQLLALSGGNPLYLRELVIGGVAEGSLHPVGGVWQLRGALPQTEELAERIHARLATLGLHAREALELVALGEPLGLDLLEGLTSLEALEELERTGTIRVEESGRRAEVRLAHPLYGEVLRASLDEAARREGARRLAGAMAATGARRATDAGPLIRWQVLAGIPTDAERILRSAEVARHHDDWVGAARLARLAHDAGLADAANLLAEAHYALGEFEEGDAIAEPAMARPGLLSDPALTSLHRTRAGVWFFASRDPLDVEAQVLEAEARVADPHLAEMLRYARAAMCMWSGRVREARALAEPLLASDDPKVAVMAAIAVETVAATAGPADGAIALTDHWFATHSALPDLNGTNSPAFHLLIKVEALVNAGHLDDALALGDLGYRASVASLNRIAQMWFARPRDRQPRPRRRRHGSPLAPRADGAVPRHLVAPAPRAGPQPPRRRRGAPRAGRRLRGPPSTSATGWGSRWWSCSRPRACGPRRGRWRPPATARGASAARGGRGGGRGRGHRPAGRPGASTPCASGPRTRRGRSGPPPRWSGAGSWRSAPAGRTRSATRRRSMPSPRASRRSGASATPPRPWSRRPRPGPARATGGAPPGLATGPTRSSPAAAPATPRATDR